MMTIRVGQDKALLKKMLHKVLVVFLLLITLGISFNRIKNNIIFDSDRLYFDEFFSDVWNFNGNLSAWKLSPAPAYFPELLFYFISGIFFVGAKARLLAATALEVGLLIYAIYRLMSIFSRDLTRYSHFIVSLIVTNILTFASAVTPIWFFISSGNTHMGVVVCSFFALRNYLLFKSNQNETKNLVFFVLWIVIGIASSPITFIAFCCPLIAIQFKDLAQKKLTTSENIWREILTIITISIGSAIGLFLPLIAPFERAFGFRSRVSFSNIQNSLSTFFHAISFSFDFNTPYLLILSLTVFFAVSMISISYLKSQIYQREVDPLDVKFLSKFVVYGLPLNILGCIISGGFSDNLSLRFCAFPIVLALVVGTSSIFSSGNTWLKKKSLLASTIALAVFLSSLTTPFAAQYPGAEVARCIQSAIDENYHLDNGLGDYIDSRAVNLLAGNGHEIRAIQSDMSPFYWTTSRDFTLNPKKYSEYFNFLIIRPDDNPGPFGIISKNMKTILTRASEIYRCKESRIKLYIYKTDFLDSLLRSSAQKTFFPTTDYSNLQILGSNLPIAIGSIQGTYAVSPRNNTKNQVFTFGPYLNLPHGRYEAAFNLEATNLFENTSCGFIEIGRFVDSPAKVLKNVAFNSAPGLREFRIPFTLQQGLLNLEIRTRVLPNCQLSVRSLNLRKI